MSLAFRGLTVLVILLASQIANAQKPETDGAVGIFANGGEYRQFMGMAKQLAYGENGNPELQAMIPMINDIVLNRPIGSTAGQYKTEASMFGMLDDENVRQDIEMVDDQYDQFNEMSSKIRENSANQLRNLDFNNHKELVDRIKMIRDQTEKELNGLLLPHQIKRLKQIRMQALLRRRSLVDVLTSNPIRSDLNISQEQTKELKQAEEIVKQDLARKIQQLQKEARDELLNHLDPSQRAEVKEMIGDTFDFIPSDTLQKSKNQKWAEERKKTMERNKKALERRRN